MKKNKRRNIFFALLAALVLLIIFWNWNWFRPLVERQASMALGRPVTLAHFDADMGLHPLFVLDGITVNNPEGYPQGSKLLTVQRLALRIDAMRLFHRGLLIEELNIEKPVGEMLTPANGEPNWAFKKEKKTGEAPAGDPWGVEIAALTVNGGQLRFTDEKLKSDFHVAFRTAAAKNGEPRLLAAAEGTYAGQPVKGTFDGSSVLTLRDQKNPYDLKLELANGKTTVDMGGTLLQPLRFGGAQVRLELRGDNLADLHPLTGLPLPPTAPYKLAGALDYKAGRVRFSDFVGTVGSSDLYGDIAVAYGNRHPDIVANLGSQKVALADLGGFIGAVPGKEDATNDTAKQKQARAKKEARGKLLPDKPLNLPQLRAADFHVSYAGERIEGARMPFDKIMAKLDIVNGRISLKPLSFSVGDGQIALNLDLDAQNDQVTAKGDIDFRRVELARIMQATSVFRGAGKIGGKARIDSHGKSLAQMLGNGDGEVQLFMSGGNLSALLVDLAGLDFGNAVLSALGIPSRARLRCMIADMELTKGQLGTRTLLFDTTEANIMGKGQINLAAEEVDYELKTQPKQASIMALKAPIQIRGTFADPSIRPELGELTARGGAAVVLGVFLTPLAALLPTIQLGLGEDHNCQAMLDDVRTAAAKQRPAPAKPDERSRARDS